MQDDSRQDQSVAEPGVVFRPNQSAVPTAQPTASVQPTPATVAPVPSQTVVTPTQSQAQSRVQPEASQAQPQPNATSPTQTSSVQQPLPEAPTPDKAKVQDIDTPESSQTTQVPTLDDYQTYATNQAVSAEESYDAPHVEWTASEYTANPKSGGWFGLLALATILVAVAVYFLTNGDIVSTAVIVVIAIMFGIFAARQPQTLNYAIDNDGFHIGQKFYPYETFKSFSVMHDGVMGYISLLPLKRFMPPLAIHYDPDDEERIANTLMEYLPYEEHKADVIDTITRKFRF